MSRVLFTYEQEMPTVTLQRISAEGHEAQGYYEARFRQLMEVTPEDMQWCDVLHMIRPNDPYSLDLARQATKMGRFVIAYYDDDLYGLPKTSPQPQWRRNNILRILRSSNAVVSSSRHICNKYKPYTLEKRGYASDTSVEVHEIKRIPHLPEQKDSSEKVKLIYAANPGHVTFFNQFILPIMPQLCRQYGDRISMTFMGVRPDLAVFEDQTEIIYMPGMPLDEYRQKIQNGNYDIGLSPLTTDEFTKCKYFNKFIEYTIAGIAGVYSNTEPYTFVVESGVNGLLVNDDPEDWLKSLGLLIEDGILRNRCICNAQNLLLSEFTPERIRQREAESVPELFHYNAPADKDCGSLQLYKLRYKLNRVMDKAYFLWFYFRQQGISGILNKLRG